MALDVSALTAYTDEISSGLAKQIVLSADTIQGNLVTKKFGVYGDTFKLNYVKSTMVGTSSACNNTDAGSTVMAQGSISMCPITFPQTICIDTLKSYWYDFEMERSYDSQSLGTFQEVFTANKMESIAKELDKIAWQGNKDTGTGNLNLCDGFLKTATDLTGEITLTRATMSTSNSVSYVNSILALVPAEILDKVELYLSPADFQSYLQDLTANYKYNAVLIGTEGIKRILHPGSIGLHINSVNGLSGVASGTFIATSKDNIVLAFGADNDMSFNMWYSMDLQALKLNSKTKMGTGFYFPELVVRSA